jgi:hypothetical protein
MVILHIRTEAIRPSEKKERVQFFTNSSGGQSLCGRTSERRIVYSEAIFVWRKHFSVIVYRRANGPDSLARGGREG